MRGLTISEGTILLKRIATRVHRPTFTPDIHAAIHRRIGTMYMMNPMKAIIPTTTRTSMVSATSEFLPP
ncbi:MAG: hypothetical protein ACD_47C00068G0004 [uncultured bacterium]|nr:MAG: hypothetical protein ACD_47C00068G0004 [uncultured bacterium]